MTKLKKSDTSSIVNTLQVGMKRIVAMQQAPMGTARTATLRLGHHLLQSTFISCQQILPLQEK